MLNSTKITKLKNFIVCEKLIYICVTQHIYLFLLYIAMDQSNDYIDDLIKNGGKVYIVGGAIRNYLYNCFHNKTILTKDYDFIICNLEEEQIISILKNYGTIKEVGQSFGIILFTPINTTESIEFALPRTEISTGSGYKDFEIIPDPFLPLEEDFSRRDSTINAIGFQIFSLYDITKLDSKKNKDFELSMFIDPYDGITDIKNKIWKAVGDPYKRFLEDPTRIMRAFRQSGELELEIEENTYSAIQHHYLLMKSLIPQSYVRLFNELIRLTYSKNCGKIILNMYDLSILNFLGIFNKLEHNQLNILNETYGILKFAIILKPESIDNIKKWIIDRQILATNNFSKNDFHILISINNYAEKIIEILNENIDAKYELLKIREQIYKIGKQNSDDILNNVLKYINITHDIDMAILNELKMYPLSTDQLAVNGNDIMNICNIKGEKIGKLKSEMLDNIYLNKLENCKNDLCSYLEQCSL